MLLDINMHTASGVHRKFLWVVFHSLACGGHLYLVCARCDVTNWRHIHVSKPTFWRTLLTQYAWAQFCCKMWGGQFGVKPL